MRQYIKDLKKGEPISGFFAVVKKEKRLTRDKKPYLNLILQDKTGRINAKIWEYSDVIDSQFDNDEPCALKGFVEEFNNELQIRITNIRRVNEEEDPAYGYDPADLILSTEKDIDDMWERIMEICRSLENHFLRDLCVAFFTKWETSIKYHPASMKLHHAYRGGFLEHTLSIAEIARMIGDFYKESDGDLLVAGALLHDVGKLRELRSGYAIEYTQEGKLIGHIVLGREMVLEEIEKIENFPEQLKLKLEHLILSHQGKKEWDSPKEPTFLEALLLHHIDELDAKYNIFLQAVQGETDAEGWTTTTNYFHRNLWNPLRGENNNSTDEVNEQ